VHGRQAQRDFHLERCSACGYARVIDPVEDLGEVYSMDYYEGRGADPLVDYMTELDEPASTIRNYEWNGVLGAVRALTEVTPATRWLDFGCGNGGLVRYLDREVGCDVVGWDEGAIVDVARDRGIRIVEDAELGALGPFDVITAVEVLEHVPDPAQTIERIAELLAPGGLFFYTTGNAQRFRERLSTWSYVIPEIHISFYEPRTMRHLLAGAGLEAVAPGWQGWPEIYRFKLLKNLRRRHRNVVTDHLPTGPAAHVFERRLGLAAFPPARKPAA
jgi:SAM-dependent methyltransferase